MCSADGLITYFNQHAVEVWGREPKINDSIDRFCGSFKLYRMDGTPVLHDECWMALAIKEEREFNGEEIVIERPDGRRVIGLAHANPIHDDSGKIIGGVNILIDITERKRAEETLKESDRAKDEFLATLAHELRNPLAPIRNAVHILRLKGTHDPDSDGALQVIERQMRQLTRLVDDLLDVGRITGNKLELRSETTSVARIIASAIEISQPQIDAGKHVLELSMPDVELSLEGDLARLSQALSNLLINAANYTPEGGRIVLSVRYESGEAVITVRDNGIGISREILPRVFDTFAQVPGRSQSGLAIGLSLARRVVDMHGGSIMAHSDGPGSGSEFVIRLPEVHEVNRKETDVLQERDYSASATLRKILVVDDNADVAESMTMLLQLLGSDVRTAGDGYKAIEVAGEFLPEIVMLDIGLPGRDGLETAREIRRQPWGRNMVLIAVTGWGQDSDFRRSREAGFDHHIVKPMDPDVLMELLDSVKGPSSRDRAAMMF
jgi:signal transduction histidine kinase/ActR/RegA family two-component response regulator